MASRQQNKCLGGITPLGVITITSGTPVQVSSLLAATDKVFAFTARQLGFSVSAASTGEFYIQYGNYSGIDANATMLIVQHGTTGTLPTGCACTEGLIDVTQIWVDGSHTGDKIAIYALDASN